LEAARSSLATGTVVRADVYPDLASRFDFWPVNTAEGRMPSLDSHSTGTNVLRHQMRWSTSFGVF
jgi:hypothetical protein